MWWEDECSFLICGKGELTLHPRIISCPEWSLCAAPCAGNGVSTAVPKQPGVTAQPHPDLSSLPAELPAQPHFPALPKIQLPHSYHTELLETECIVGLLSHSQCCFSSPLPSGFSFLSLSPFVSLLLPGAVIT